MIHTVTCTLCLTHDCTLRCNYCYAGSKYRHAMAQETARKALDICIAEAKRTGRGLDVSFFGGEPLLEWELLQWCWQYTEAHKEGLIIRPRYGITTNGTLLTPERLQWLAKRDFLIGLSIDGSPAMHNTNRCYANGRGSHEAVARALALIDSYPSIRSKAICVVTPNNVQHLAEGTQWLAEHYHGEIGLNIDYWSEWTDANFDTLCEQFNRVAAMVLESYRSGAPIALSNIEHKILSHIRARDNTPCLHCAIGEREIAVSADGNFFPCSRLVGIGDEPELNFGNVHSGIDRARQEWIIAHRGNSTPACKLCALRHRCVNTCGCTNHAASGHIDQVSPFLCASEHFFIETADTLAETLYAERNPNFLHKFYSKR